ncbi:MAG: hypothetical protein MRK01_04835 [Candidatus Scalindua sp.]|nr:hypothetical protein [Candidatus Scalindua sp.]
MANKIIEINKINKEPVNNRIANDGGVGSTDLLDEAAIAENRIPKFII